MHESTINYFSFKTIDSNRPVDPNHVKRLVAAISKKNLLHLHPIVVNSKMEVIDGQHRLAAAKELKIYIPYVIDSTITKEDIATINSNAKNWNMLDYINYWATEKAPGFDKIMQFMIQNPLFPPSSILQLLSKGQMRDSNKFREGVVDVSNFANAMKIAEVIKELSLTFKHAYDRNFIMAVLACFNTPGYDHDIMKRKVEFQPRSLVKCISTKQYLEMLDEIYNYQSSKNRLTLK